MKFDEYMFLKEDFDHTPESKTFGEPTPTSKKPTNDPVLKASDNGISQADKSALAGIKEACEYILYMIECELGVDKLEKPDSEGFSTAVNAINKFASAGDGKNFSIPNVGIKYDYNKDDEVEVHESSLGNAGDEDDEFLTIRNGIDTNTIPAHNLEKDQFIRSEDISSDMFDNSNNGWDKDWDDSDDIDTNWDI
jgi:hypothetical protein